VILTLRLRANGLFHSSVKKTTFWVKNMVAKSMVIFVIKFQTNINRMPVSEVLLSPSRNIY